MKKTDKKTENYLRGALTDVCEIALDEVTGFKWITHFVTYSNFPSSLLITCVFDTNNELESALNTHKDDYLRSLIKDKLSVAITTGHPSNIQNHFANIYSTRVFLGVHVGKSNDGRTLKTATPPLK